MPSTASSTAWPSSWRPRSSIAMTGCGGVVTAGTLPSRTSTSGTCPPSPSPTWRRRPRHEVHHYPFAGGPNAHVTLRIASIAGPGSWMSTWPRQEDDYLARVVPEAGGTGLRPCCRGTSDRCAGCGSRRTGRHGPLDGRVRPLDQPGQQTRALADGRILRTTERSGFRHLELRPPDGELDRAADRGAWVVTAVVPSLRRGARFSSSRRATASSERHLYAVPLDVDEPTRIRGA